MFIPLGQPEYGSGAKNTRGALYGSYFKIETNGRSSELRFGIGARLVKEALAWVRRGHGNTMEAAFEPRFVQR